MTNAEKKMILFLMTEGGCDYCQKCIHLNKKSCIMYSAEDDDFSGKHDMDYCIKGMRKYFEKHNETD